MNTKTAGKTGATLILFVVVLALITIGIYYNSKDKTTKSKHEQLPIPEGSSLSINGLKQTLMNHARKEWILDAKSAHYDDATNRIILNGLSMVFYMKNDEKAWISADSGIMDNESKNAEISGRVTLKYKDIRVSADKLHYDHDKRLIFSDIPIQIIGDSFQLTSNHLSIDLETRKAVFEGNVNGFFSENIPL